MMKKYPQYGLLAFLSTLIGFASPAMATGTDFSSITSAIDWSSVVTGIVAVAAAVTVLYIAWKGSKMLAAAVKGI
jgi:hypothetical protein